MAVCCQNLTLGALSSRSALSFLFGALFKKFVLFLNTPIDNDVAVESTTLIFRVIELYPDRLLSDSRKEIDRLCV
jgi:hypothetical protein